MARRAKKQHHEEHENHERWLVSYADLLTLLFAFFVVMYAVSRVDNQRLVQVAQAIRFAMHFEGTGGVGDLPIFEGPAGGAPAAVGNGGGPGLTAVEMARAERLRKRLERQLQPMLLGRKAGAVILDAEGRRLTVRLSAGRFFGGGEAVLHPEAMPVLDAIALELGPTDLPLRIEGHTDDRPTRGRRFRDNWELSASRAAAVVSYLEAAHGLAGRRLTAAGLADTRPVESNDDEAGRDANRRVDVVVELPTGDALERLAR